MRLKTSFPTHESPLKSEKGGRRVSESERERAGGFVFSGRREMKREEVEVV